MKTPNSYEEVNRELEECNELIELDSNDETIPVEDDESPEFHFEYAFESLTEGHSAYKRRNSNV